MCSSDLTWEYRVTVGITGDGKPLRKSFYSKDKTGREAKRKYRDYLQQKEEEISKENAEQLLESAMQDEKDVQEKVKKLMQIKGRKLDKDW